VQVFALGDNKMKNNIKLLIAIACLVCYKTDRIAAIEIPEDDLTNISSDPEPDTDTDTYTDTDTDGDGNQGTSGGGSSTGSGSFDVPNQQSAQPIVQPVTTGSGNNQGFSGIDLNDSGIFEITTDEDDNQIEDEDENGMVEVDLSNAAESIKENPTDPRTFSEALEKINQVITDKSLTPIQTFSQFFEALGDLLSTVWSEITTAFKNIPSLQSSIEESIPANTSDLSSERITAIQDDANNPKDVAGALAILGIDKTDISLVTQADITAATSDPSFEKYQTELLATDNSSADTYQNTSLYTFTRITQAISTLQQAITPTSSTYDLSSNTTTNTYPDGGTDVAFN